ncbi:MAG: hypothetical protein ABI778_01165 [Ignavibacteriota bacterium]
MKTLLGILIAVSMVSCGQLSAPHESNDRNGLRLRHEENPVSDSTFTITNTTAFATDSLLLELNGSEILVFNIAGVGTFSKPISITPLNCKVNGHSLLYGIATWVAIDEQKSIRATWTSNVVVIDREEQN